MVAGRVAVARVRAVRRWSDPRWAGAGAMVNGSVPGPVVRAYWDELAVDRTAVDRRGAGGSVDRTGVRPGVAVGVDQRGSGRSGSAGAGRSVPGVGAAVWGGAVTAVSGSSRAAGDSQTTDSPVDEDVRVARAGLLRVAEPQSSVLSAFVEHLGPLVAWERICNGECAAAGAQGGGAAVGGDGRARDVGAGGDGSVGRGSVWSTAGDPGRRGVAHGGDGRVRRSVAEGMLPPLGLWVRGGPLLPGPWGAVTVVGSRASTPYGARVAAELAVRVGGGRSLVVSGAAFGIDAAAHRGALATNDFGGAGPVTLAVLACGIDRAYPSAHEVLLESIAERGAVVSEYPPGTTPARHRFLVRNRLIAAFGEATVVVEAGRRSGSTATFRAARELNRVAIAVPGPVTSALSAGCHELIANEGALLVTGAADVLATLGCAGGPAVGADDGAAPGEDPQHPTDGLEPDAARVYDAFPTPRVVFGAGPGDRVRVAGGGRHGITGRAADARSGASGRATVAAGAASKRGGRPPMSFASGGRLKEVARTGSPRNGTYPRAAPPIRDQSPHRCSPTDARPSGRRQRLRPNCR